MELWSRRTQKNRPLVIIHLCQVLFQQHKAMSLHFCSLPPPAFDLQLVLMGSILGNTCTTLSTSNHAGCVTKDECREEEEQGKSAKERQVVGSWLLISPQNMTHAQLFVFFIFQIVCLSASPPWAVHFQFQLVILHYITQKCPAGIKKKDTRDRRWWRVNPCTLTVLLLLPSDISKTQVFLGTQTIQFEQDRVYLAAV